MDLISIYRLVDVCVQLNQLMADIKEANDWYPSRECMTTLELLQERRRAANEQQHRCDFEEQQRCRDIYDYDDVDGHQT